jgi:hypothetical protein
MPTKKKDHQIPLRNAVRRVFREIREFSGEPFELAQEVSRGLKGENKPWSRATLDAVYDTLYECCHTMGDHPVWNRGGQGYTAMAKLRAARKDVPPPASPTPRPTKIKVALIANAGVEASVVIDIPPDVPNPEKYAETRALELSATLDWEITHGGMGAAEVAGTENV